MPRMQGLPPSMAGSTVIRSKSWKDRLMTPNDSTASLRDQQPHGSGAEDDPGRVDPRAEQERERGEQDRDGGEVHEGRATELEADDEHQGEGADVDAVEERG